jgi:A/G-specific adenine glycosylase
MKRVAADVPGLDAGCADPDFSALVIQWQSAHGRHALPWQRTRDPYRVWLSEIMLQQTQVAAVIPYYKRFLERFPDVASLASAQSEEVMAHWSGLGYYSRARNLHQCAKKVVSEYGGAFPSDPAQLAELPGIGRSTAAAIAAFSYGVRAAILDGNVKRVFARVFGIDRYPGEKKTEEQLWHRAVALLPHQDIEGYTQGLMDLGATVCTRSRPDCSRCPLASRCIAFRTGRTAELPVRKPKTAKPERSTVMLVVTCSDEVLLEQRADTGIWGGLQSLPELPACVNTDAERTGVNDVASTLGSIASIEALSSFSHGFTHFKLHVRPYHVRLDRRHAAGGKPPQVWLSTRALESAPLPAPVKKLLLQLFATDDLLKDL